MPRKVERECPVCAVVYKADPVRLRHGRQTTCSRDCSYRFRASQQEQGVAVTCGVCGKEFTRTPSHIKSKHGVSFCSPACQYAGRSLGLTPRVVEHPYVLVAPPQSAESRARAVATRRARNGYQHSDDTVARLREATTRRIAEGRIPAVSKLEDVVAAVLDEFRVGYRRQVAIRGAAGRYVAAVDFLLDDGRVLEVNGTFWHADPRVYPNGPEHASQRRTAERWRRKIAALADQGVSVIEVWELDLRDDPAQAVRVALS